MICQLDILGAALSVFNTIGMAYKTIWHFFMIFDYFFSLDVIDLVLSWFWQIEKHFEALCPMFVCCICAFVWIDTPRDRDLNNRYWNKVNYCFLSMFILGVSNYYVFILLKFWSFFVSNTYGLRKPSNVP